MILNYKYEVYPNEEQKRTLDYWVSICRQQYNSALLDKQNHYKKYGKGLSRTALQKQQTKDKMKYPFLKSIPSQPLQEVFFRLEKAFDSFFKGDSKYPKQKIYKDYNSMTFTQFGMDRQKQKNKKTGEVKHRLVRRAVSFGKGRKLQVTGLGLIDIKLHRPISGNKVRQVIIKRQGNRWFAIFSVERHVNQRGEVEEYKTTGIDVGINKFAVLSNGEEIKNPRFLLKEEKKLKRVQRKLSRMEKGSSNWKKQLQKVQNIHVKVANQRRDFLHKQSYHLSNTYGVVCVEDLKIKNMVKNRHLAQSIHDAGWGMFRRFLEYKCERNGGLFVKVKPHYTSQNCSNCEARVEKSLSIRTHVCSTCGTVLDRDHNAALNIEKAGLKQMGIRSVDK